MYSREWRYWKIIILGRIHRSIKEHLHRHSAENNLDAYIDSRKLNMDCKKAIEEAIARNFDGMHLKEDAAKASAGADLEKSV